MWGLEILQFQVESRSFSVDWITGNLFSCREFLEPGTG